MSERTFFTLRYALPGYAFVLMFVLVAYPELPKILSNISSQFKDVKLSAELVIAFLAFFTLLGGSALGFLVSQVWYVFYNFFLRGRYGRIPDTMTFLRGRYNLREDDLNRQIVFLDYVHRLNKNKETLIYAQRRYDLLQLIGSTFVTIVIGSFFGLLIRTDCFSAITWEITTYDTRVILIIALLLIFLFLGSWRVGREHAMTIDFSVREVVNSGRFPDWKARRPFTNDYFSNEDRNEDCNLE